MLVLIEWRYILRRAVEIRSSALRPLPFIPFAPHAHSGVLQDI